MGLVQESFLSIFLLLVYNTFTDCARLSVCALQIAIGLCRASLAACSLLVFFAFWPEAQHRILYYLETVCLTTEGAMLKMPNLFSAPMM